MSYIIKIDSKENKFWCLNDQLHREDDLPAVEYANGNKRWYINDLLHREKYLPAIEHANGDKVWYYHGEIHREDGSAIERGNGQKEWYFNGVQAPWLEEALKIKAHLDDILSQNESLKSKRKI